MQKLFPHKHESLLHITFKPYTTRVFTKAEILDCFNKLPPEYCVTTFRVYVPAGNAGIIAIIMDGLFCTITCALTASPNSETNHKPQSALSPAIFMLFPNNSTTPFGVSTSFTLPDTLSFTSNISG